MYDFVLVFLFLFVRFILVCCTKKPEKVQEYPPYFEEKKEKMQEYPPYLETVPSATEVPFNTMCLVNGMTCSLSHLCHCDVLVS